MKKTKIDVAQVAPGTTTQIDITGPQLSSQLRFAPRENTDWPQSIKANHTGTLDPPPHIIYSTNRFTPTTTTPLKLSEQLPHTKKPTTSPEHSRPETRGFHTQPYHLTHQELAPENKEVKISLKITLREGIGSQGGNPRSRGGSVIRRERRVSNQRVKSETDGRKESI